MTIIPEHPMMAVEAWAFRAWIVWLAVAAWHELDRLAREGRRERLEARVDSG